MSDISGQRHEQEDGTLWDWVGDIQFKSYPQMRPYIGDFYEQATRVLLLATRLKTDSGKICPDLQLPTGEYIECKSVGMSNASILYKHRIEKYDAFMDDGHTLYYVFWRHACTTSKVTSLFELRRKLAEKTRVVIIVDGREVHRVARTGPERFTSYSGTKTNPSLYKLKPAHTISGPKIRAWGIGQADLAFMGNVYGVPMPQIPVFSNYIQWRF